MAKRQHQRNRHNGTRVRLLSPKNWTFNPWGGDWIPRFKKIAVPKKPVGESWEFSTHPSQPSRPRVFKGRAPLLVKLIDARDNLSLQVHPPEWYARKHEKDHGKWESWFILGTGPRAADGYIYLGFRKKKRRGTLKANFYREFNAANALGPSTRRPVRRKAERRVLPFVNKIKVRAGEVYDIPPGMIHAIGRGVRLLEIQQTSGLTYRIWDWNRPDPEKLKKHQLAFRTLHAAKAFDVLDFKPRDPRTLREPVHAPKDIGGWKVTSLIQRAEAGYGLSRALTARRGAGLHQSTKDRFHVITNLAQPVVVRGGSASTVKLPRGHSCFVPGGAGSYTITATTARADVVISYPVS